MQQSPYEARKPGVTEQIVEMAHNGAGGRDTRPHLEKPSFLRP
ncbi:hypothetical protein HVY09_25825 (plasmid) [Escherichia coli]|nr:hypothetical protein HVY09_25825 [Escherichia coli]